MLIKNTKGDIYNIHPLFTSVRVREDCPLKVFRIVLFQEEREIIIDTYFDEESAARALTIIYDALSHGYVGCLLPDDKIFKD